MVARRGLETVRGIVLAVIGSILLTISAKIQVPFWPVPMTMQTFVVLVLGVAYGWRLAGATVLLYLAQGALSLPVFAAGGGLAYMSGPTGGYLVGFLLAAVAVGWLAERSWARSVGEHARGDADRHGNHLRLRHRLVGHADWSAAGDQRRTDAVPAERGGQDRARDCARAVCMAVAAAKLIADPTGHVRSIAVVGLCAIGGGAARRLLDQAPRGGLERRAGQDRAARRAWRRSPTPSRSPSGSYA